MKNLQQQSLFKTYLNITVVIALYWFVSITLVFVNKFLLSSSDVKLDAPIFITWFQCIVSVILCLFLHFTSIISLNLTNNGCLTIKQVLPLSFVFVGMITFNNLCLKYVDISFYYIGRSLTTVFNVSLSYLILGQKTSSPAIICCGVIIFGFLLGIDQENIAGSLSIVGVIFGILASMFVALYSIYIKKILPLVQNKVIQLTFYNNLNATIIFLPLIILNGEHQQLLGFHGIISGKFWFLMMIGGIFGFAIGFLTSLQVQVTSPLTNNISGTAKACAQTVLATVWFKEVKPVFWWASNGVILLGSAAYTRVRQLEMHKEYSSKSQEIEKPLNPV